ncbi:MAG TPA: hypothetical protein VKV17_13375 [Bryobacteraceae bacterium]|nr:hypothetical protein [Bryobacteraceae bacterium]
MTPGGGRCSGKENRGAGPARRFATGLEAPTRRFRRFSAGFEYLLDARPVDTAALQSNLAHYKRLEGEDKEAEWRPVRPGLRKEFAVYTAGFPTPALMSARSRL